VFSPAASLFNTIYLVLAGRLHFPRGRKGEQWIDPDGRWFTIFRQVIVDPGKGQPPKPGARFQVRFHVANMTPQQNERFSVIPIPFIVGLPGFRSKLWMIDKGTGDFQGIYEWDTLQFAQRYAGSFAMRFMTGRARTGSVSYSITPQ
jgi:hypothetical protein